MAIETRSLAANGLTFAADCAGEGDTVTLLLHGFPESRASWREQLPALAALGWRAVAPDLRGYGESSRPRGKAAYRIERLVEDAAALFEALGARRRVLIGHDWGGAIAWAAALRGVPLDGLVILNAPHPTAFRRALKTWDQRVRSWYMAFFLLPWLPELMLTWRGGRELTEGLAKQTSNFPPELLETMRRNVTAPGAATAMLNYYRANILRYGKNGGEPAPIECPTLLIWGEDDIYLGPGLASGNEAFARNLTLRRLPGVSHWVQQDAPEVVNDTIAEWARGQGLTGGS
uniref:alpha/beta fold hydrolase n=1 Tax=Altererythrobacter segetis TaxID=1104773 RepID=UPI00140C2441|nr:alpha/beta fold hydrolase [Altererythrobacter segetis]